MGSGLRNCKRCGKIFVYAGVPVCPECLEKEEAQYSKVKRYLDANPGAGVDETSEQTGVPPEMVIEFLRQGLLVHATGPGGQLTCAICHRPIIRGRLCPKCEASLAAAAGKGVPPDRGSNPRESLSDRDRMYVIDLITRRGQ